MAKRNKEVKISDLKNIKIVLKKVKEISGKMFYTRIGNKDNLEILGIGDAAYKSDKNSIGVELIFVKEADFSRASFVYWKTRQIWKFAHSSKDVESLNIS